MIQISYFTFKILDFYFYFFVSKLLELKLTKSEKYSLICQLLFFVGGGWSVVEERKYIEAATWEVIILQVNMVLNGSGSKYSMICQVEKYVWWWFRLYSDRDLELEKESVKEFRVWRDRDRELNSGFNGN